MVAVITWGRWVVTIKRVPLQGRYSSRFFSSITGPPIFKRKEWGDIPYVFNELRNSVGKKTCRICTSVDGLVDVKFSRKMLYYVLIEFRYKLFFQRKYSSFFSLFVRWGKQRPWGRRRLRELRKFVRVVCLQLHPKRFTFINIYKFLGEFSSRRRVEISYLLKVTEFLLDGIEGNTSNKPELRPHLCL